MRLLVKALNPLVLLGLATVPGYAYAGWEGTLSALSAVLILYGVGYWFADRLVLIVFGAKRISPDDAPLLYQTVLDLAHRARLPPPRVYLVQSDTPNAFATGRNPSRAAVAATVGLLRLLDNEELAGVLAHELAHIRNRDTPLGRCIAAFLGSAAMAAVICQNLVFSLSVARRGAGHRWFGRLGSRLVSFLAPVTASLVVRAVSRSREFAADADGAAICGNPLWLARALRKLDAASRPDSVKCLPGVGVRVRERDLGRLLKVHPAVDERIRRLERMARGGTSGRRVFD